MSAFSIQKKLLHTAYAFAGLGALIAVGQLVPAGIHHFMARDFAGKACFGFIQDLAKEARSGEPVALGPGKAEIEKFRGEFEYRTLQGLRADRILRENLPAFHAACTRWADEIYQRCRDSVKDGRSLGIAEVQACGRGLWYEKVYEARLMPYAQWRWNQDKALDLAAFDRVEAEDTTRIPGRTPATLSAQEASAVLVRPVEAFDCAFGDLKGCRARARQAFAAWKGDQLPEPLHAAFVLACRAGDTFSCLVPEMVTGTPDVEASALVTTPRVAALDRECTEGNDAYACMAMAYVPTELDENRKFVRQQAFLTRACGMKLGYACSLFGGEVMHRLRQTKYSKEALPYYDQACALSDASGCHGSGRLHHWNSEPDKAAAGYARACELGSAEACTDLGLLELEGKGVAWSRIKARRHFRLACETRSARGCYYLGYSHETGQGADLDTTVADQLYSQACQLGHRASCDKVGMEPPDGALLLGDGGNGDEDDSSAPSDDEDGDASAVAAAARPAGRMPASVPDDADQDEEDLVPGAQPQRVAPAADDADEDS